MPIKKDIMPPGQSDKFIHFFLYLILFQLWYLAGIKNVFRLSLYLFFFSFFIEILQELLPVNRSFSLLDMIANLAGIYTGYIISRINKHI